MQPKLHHKLHSQGDWVSRGINGLPVPCSPPLLHLPLQREGDVGLSLRLQVPNLGDLSPLGPIWEVSVSLVKALSLSLHLHQLLLSCKADPHWTGMDSASSALCTALVTPCPGTHTHTDTRALPPLLPPGDVTLLLVGSVIPFLTF